MSNHSEPFKEVSMGPKTDKPKDSVQNSRKRGQSKEGSQRWMNP